MSETQLQLEPSIIVIFGITGDLSHRFLLPAMYHLVKDALLHEKTRIVGVSRQQVTTDELLNKVELCVNEVDSVCDPEALKKMYTQTSMLQIDMEQDEDYVRLQSELHQIEADSGVCMNRIYYLSIPPKAYTPVIERMGRAGLNGSCDHGTAKSRILVEKPFGYDLTSAQQLVSDTSQVFHEDQIFRIDHYLAKETVQNILTFRFENPIFESLWNREHIASIEIFAGEQIGIAGRAKFYDPLGALRDFIQSHLLQLLALVTMEKPEVVDSENIHAAKHTLLQSVQAIPENMPADRVVRGQYDTYAEEIQNPDSKTETFAGIKTYINNSRWEGVPIVVWTGKGLADKRTEVTVNFNKKSDGVANRLRFRLQPDEGIQIDLIAKKPGYDTELQTVEMDFAYATSFADHAHPNAYERVLVDAVRGDHTLFSTSSEVLEAWRIVQPVLDAWSQSHEKPSIYPVGTAGETLAQPLLHDSTET